MNNSPPLGRSRGHGRLVARMPDESVAEWTDLPLNPKLAQVSNPALLAELLRARIDADFGGSLNCAAKAAGVSQPTLYRRVIGTRRRKGQKPVPSRSPISRVVLTKLLKFLGDAASREAINAVMSQRASEAAIQYSKWNRRFHSDAVDDSRDDRVRAVPPEDGQPWNGRLIEFQSLWTKLANELPHVRIDMFKEFEVPAGFARQGPNEIRQRRSGILIARFFTAIYRIFLPLLEAKESGWIERRGHELSPSEFQSFVECGWEREKILLSRPGDLQRAQRSPSLQALALAALPNLLAPNVKSSAKLNPSKGRVSKGGRSAARNHGGR